MWKGVLAYDVKRDGNHARHRGHGLVLMPPVLVVMLLNMGFLNEVEKFIT